MPCLPPSGKAPLLLIWVDHLASAVLFTESCFNISLSSHPQREAQEGFPRGRAGLALDGVSASTLVQQLLTVLAQDGKSHCSTYLFPLSTVKTGPEVSPCKFTSVKSLKLLKVAFSDSLETC